MVPGGEPVLQTGVDVWWSAKEHCGPKNSPEDIPKAHILSFEYVVNVMAFDVKHEAHSKSRHNAEPRR